MIEKSNQLVDEDIPISESPSRSTRPDSQSLKEEGYLSLQEIKNTTNKVINRAIRWVGHTMLGLIIIILLIRVYHLILPEKICWLNNNQITSIDHIILAVIAGLIARFFPNENLPK